MLEVCGNNCHAASKTVHNNLTKQRVHATCVKCSTLSQCCSCPPQVNVRHEARLPNSWSEQAFLEHCNPEPSHSFTNHILKLSHFRILLVHRLSTQAAQTNGLLCSSQDVFLPAAGMSRSLGQTPFRFRQVAMAFSSLSHGLSSLYVLNRPSCVDVL